MLRNPKVIDPPGFDQHAAWKECEEYVDKCGGLAYPDGEPNWRAAFGADPGCCSCPKCKAMYWCWGRVQECLKCGFRYPTDWWCMYSWGVQARNRQDNPPPAYQDAEIRRRMESHDAERMSHPYFRYGYEHPVPHPRCEDSANFDWAALAPPEPQPSKEGK
jgi:hypothetical protein